MGGSLIDSVHIQTEKIRDLTRSMEEKKRIVRSSKNRIMDCREYFEPMIALKKYNLEIFINN